MGQISCTRHAQPPKQWLGTIRASKVLGWVSLGRDQAGHRHRRDTCEFLKKKKKTAMRRQIVSQQSFDGWHSESRVSDGIGQTRGVYTPKES